MREAIEADNDLRQRTKTFALRIIRMYNALPAGQVAKVIGNQVLRSGSSVGANYREAFRSRSDAEFIAKIGEILKELDETAYWLELLVESEVMPLEKLAALLDETDQLIAIFTTIVKNKKKKG
ncbi:MAG: four helix bundle protein [Anaerolineae bacterium]|nr:four helix bundle protein [Anaerolineae bacterium]